MTSNYEKIILENLAKVRERPAAELEAALPAAGQKDGFHFRAFGKDCVLCPDHIRLAGHREAGPEGLLVSLYGLHVTADPILLTPFQAFKDFPGSMPYQGAFSANSERVLVPPHVLQIRERTGTLLKRFGGDGRPEGAAGDFALLLYPLPKIALCYIFYLEDEDFPASVTCLYSANAGRFMPLDGLADVAEYTSKGVIDLLREDESCLNT